MQGKKALRQAQNKFHQKKANNIDYIPGNLGFLINNQQRVSVASRSGFVYVRLRSATSEVIQAFNDSVSTVYDLPVLVSRDVTHHNRYHVVGTDSQAYPAWNSSYLAKHGAQHSFNPPYQGGDIVWVYGRQFMPMLGYPNGTSGAMNILIDEYNHYYDGTWQSVGNTGTASLTPYKPTDDTARMVLVYIDEFGNPELRGGTVYFPASISGTSAMLPYVPDLLANEFPVCGIRLVSGTIAIVWENIYDLRDHFGGQVSNFYAKNNESFITVTGSANLLNERILTPGAGIVFVDEGAGGDFIISAVCTGTSGSGGHIIEEEGVPLPARTYLDFVGVGIEADDDPANDKTTIYSYGHIIQDDWIPFTPRTSLNFMGAGVVVTDDPGDDTTIVTISGGSGTWHNLLGGLQGGIPNEYYHLDSAQDIGLVSGVSTILHTHSHLNLENIGINTHAQIDTFLGLSSGTFLRLDASNSPLTGGLAIVPATDTLTAFVVNDKDSNNVLTVDTINNRVGIGTTSPNANALLDLTSTTKAFMPPRMTTTQRDAIASPTEGMVIYNLTTHVLNFYSNSAWGAV